MNPGSESEEDVGIGYVMEEAVVEMVESMVSVTEAVEAMVTSVDMLECLEEGRPEMERIAATRFFSRALACPKDLCHPKYLQVPVLPLYWPGRLPELIPLLSDCLLPHNSQIIQSNAMLSLKHLVFTSRCIMVSKLRRTDDSLPTFEMVFESYAPENLICLVRESDCHEIRNQALKVLGYMAADFPPDYQIYLCSAELDCLPLITDLVRQYAAILEPNETEMASLNAALKALNRFCVWKLDDVDLEHISEILPVITSIFQEPGNRKKAQMHAVDCLNRLSNMRQTARKLLMDKGVLGVMLETLRVGKESADVLAEFLAALGGFLNPPGNRGRALNLGALDALHQVLKHPCQVFPKRRYEDEDTWSRALELLSYFSKETPVYHEAILSEDGLVERVLEMGLELELTEVTQKLHHYSTIHIVQDLATLGPESQTRRVMSKALFFRLLARYLNAPLSSNHLILIYWRSLMTLQGCLAVPGSAEGLRLRRLLLDNAGITADAVHRIASANLVPFVVDLAQDIIDTYLKDPTQLPPISKLPLVIYTKNAPY